MVQAGAGVTRFEVVEPSLQSIFIAKVGLEAATAPASAEEAQRIGLIWRCVDDAEKAAIKLRTFIDKISTAPRGYSGLFDAVKINEKELEAVYQFDAAFFDLAEQVSGAVDNFERSLGDEAALPAAIRNVVALARLAVETYEKRSEVVTGSK